MKTTLIWTPLWYGIYVSLLFGIFIAMIMQSKPVYAASYVPVTGSVNIGERSSNVSNLQMFLAANPSVYPEGLVTGYFGPLTKAAVLRFQAKYGIDQVGRVGPITLSKINTLINGGGWDMVADSSGPVLYSVNNSVTSNSATINWNTDEMANAKIFYSTSYVTMNEGDINSVGFGATSGSVATNDGLARTSQQVIINGLQPNTRYYYIVVSTDLAGNVSVWNPNTTFTTNS